MSCCCEAASHGYPSDLGRSRPQHHADTGVEIADCCEWNAIPAIFDISTDENKSYGRGPDRFTGLVRREGWIGPVKIFCLSGPEGSGVEYKNSKKIFRLFPDR